MDALKAMAGKSSSTSEEGELWCGVGCGDVDEGRRGALQVLGSRKGVRVGIELDWIRSRAASNIAPSERNSPRASSQCGGVAMERQISDAGRTMRRRRSEQVAMDSFSLSAAPSVRGCVVLQPRSMRTRLGNHHVHVKSWKSHSSKWSPRAVERRPWFVEPYVVD
jgi:hypothetical protein